ncbi:MAG: TIR domain-containing protein [Desulfobacteraceae bacterium]|nr:TIR domain-containing protein [Desulfobacteraceae bacterium]
MDFKNGPVAISQLFHAAETGCLVIIELCANCTHDAILQLKNVCNADEISQFNFQLARNLKGIICQKLIPKTGGGNVPVFEILRSSRIVNKMFETGIYDGDAIHALIENNQALGMISFEQSAISHYKKGLVDEDVILNCLKYKNLVLDRIKSIKSRIGEATTSIESLEIQSDYKLGRSGNDRETKTLPSDTLDCTVFCPSRITSGDILFVQVFVHIPEKLDKAQTMAKLFDEDTVQLGAKPLNKKIKHNSQLDFHLVMKGCSIEEPLKFMVWNGRTQSLAFDVEVPPDHPSMNLVGKIVISQNTIPLGHILFKIKVTKGKDTPIEITEKATAHQAQWYKQAFISYSSKDRNEVLRRVQMLSSLKLSYFQDIINIEPGSIWEKELYHQIDQCDVFFLFWSTNAKKSNWVSTELNYAIKKNNSAEDAKPVIIPIPIEGPPIPDPPDNLAHLHFNDKLLYFLSKST